MLKHIQMFVTGNNFFESADYCMNAKDSFLKGFNTPAIVNYAFACEVYLLDLCNIGFIIEKLHKARFCKNKKII